MNNAIFENLTHLDGEGCVLSEKRLYELSELSELLWRKIREGKISLKTPYSFADGVSLILEREEKTPRCLDSYRPYLFAARKYQRLLDIAALSRFLSERVEDGFFAPVPACDGKASGRVAYVRSALSEAAYTRIAKEKDISVLYVSGAAEAFASLSASEADYALLPLSYQDGERISSIEKLAERYGAYITAILSAGDGEREALFALYSLSPASFAVGEKRYIEWQTISNTYEDVSVLMSLTSLFGHTLVQYKCTPSEYGRIKCRAVLCGNGDDTALWFFLSLAAGGFSLLGVYPLLSKE